MSSYVVLSYNHRLVNPRISHTQSSASVCTKFFLHLNEKGHVFANRDNDFKSAGSARFELVPELRVDFIFSNRPLFATSSPSIRY